MVNRLLDGTNIEAARRHKLQGRRPMLMRTNPPLAVVDEPSAAWAGSEWLRPGAGAPGALDLRTFLRLLRWHARLIAVVTLATLMAILAGLTLVPPKFKATNLILLDPREPRVTN